MDLLGPNPQRINQHQLRVIGMSKYYIRASEGELNQRIQFSFVFMRDQIVRRHSQAASMRGQKQVGSEPEPANPSAKRAVGFEIVFRPMQMKYIG